MELGIDQRAGIADARRVILESLRATEDVLREPEPVVVFDEIADYTNNLVVLFWLEPPTRLSELQTRSLVTERLNDALQAAGVGFPYPIRDLRVRTPEALGIELQG